MAEHDGGYKRLFSHPEMMADLLRGFVREDWVADLDFATLTKYPTTFINEQLRERRDDVIWRLRRGSEDIYIYRNPRQVVNFSNRPLPALTRSPLRPAGEGLGGEGGFNQQRN